MVLCESRVVKVPAGPLIHVEGQVVSIHCDVSKYEGPSDQDFDWAMVHSDGKVINIISTTFDSRFTHSSMKDRVNSGDISFNKLGDSSVELKFKKVRATDSGLYRCTTPSTDSVTSGNYFADVELKGGSCLLRFYFINKNTDHVLKLGFIPYRPFHPIIFRQFRNRSTMTVSLMITFL